MARPRFSLRWKIALLIAALLVVVEAALAFVTVYRPWVARLANQRFLARERVRPLAPTIVRLSAQGVSFNDDVMRQLVLNSDSTPGQELLFALLYDDKGQLLETASVANAKVLGQLSPRLLALYRTEPRRALEQLEVRRADVQRLAVALKLEGSDAPVGKMMLGLLTTRIDADARRELLNELLVLAGALLLVLVVAPLAAGRVTRALDDLARSMGRMQKGDLAADLEQQSRAGDEIGDLARAFNEMLHGLRERERLRGTLGRYVSGDVAERILSERDDLSLPGETRYITVLFLDVRGFTSLSELLTPQELVALLNDYFQVMVEAVQSRGGTVNKFIGDAALCLWGAPRAVPAPELSAVQAALAIQRGSAALSQSRIARGLPVVEFGIGINAGEALAGNLGAATRLEYTVIGDAVNVAQRLESQAKAGEVLVSQTVYDKVRAVVEVEARAPVRLKGKSEPVPLWEVRGMKLGAALLALACLALPLGCEREQTGAADELTITVRGDRRELEQQEKDLEQREQELRAQSRQIESRIDELAKMSGTAGSADAEQRRRDAEQQRKEIAARIQSLLAEKGQVEAERSAAAPAAAAGPSAGALAARESQLAAREERARERDADLVRREKELAAREAAQAEVERSFAAKLLEQKGAAAAPAPAPAARNVPLASSVAQRQTRLLEELRERGVLISDLPVEDQPLNADIGVAREQGDLTRASDLLAKLERAAKAVQVDQEFVQRKVERLKQKRAAAKLNDAQKQEVDGLLIEVSTSFTDGHYDTANRGLNRIAKILDAGGGAG